MAFTDFYRLSSHAVIVNSMNEVLLLKATYTDCVWGLPGGALDMGETIHEALLRECMEELGCKVRLDYLSGVYFHSVVNSHVFIFRCHLEEGSKFSLSDEHSELRWFAIDQLSDVQKQRVLDCLDFSGEVKSRAF